MQDPLAFVIEPDLGGGCHVRLVDAKNHEIIFWTENYRDLRSAQYAIRLVKRNVARARVINLYQALVRRIGRGG